MQGVLDAVEGFFSAVTRRRVRRGVFKSVADLEDAIRRYIADHNRHAKPFAWTKAPDEILEKLTCIPSGGKGDRAARLLWKRPGESA